MKLHFLRPDSTSLASPDPTLLDAVRAQLLHRPGVVEVDDCAQADALVLHEPWAFREWRYIDRLIADPVVGRFSHKVYTLNSDDSAAGLLRGLYTCLANRLFDPSLHVAMPFLTQPNEEVLSHAGTPRAPAHYLATWRGNPKSNRRVRARLLDMFANSSNVKVESTTSWLDHGAEEKLHYVQLLRAARFSLCPGGWAAASFRIFESMALGVAPVIIADQFVEPRGPDWSSFSLRIKEADLASLEAVLAQHEDRYQEMGVLAYQAWKRYFHPDLLMGYCADALLDCVHRNAGHGSPDQDIVRWRSRRMYKGNRWTLPQRLSNRVRRLAQM